MPAVVMSWFGSGRGADVIGDVPADAVGRALTEMAQSDGERRAPALTVGTLLAAIAAALRSAPELVEGTGGPVLSGRLVARFADGAQRAQAETADDRQTHRLIEAFSELTREYVAAWERKPRLSELLDTVVFVLDADMPRYVADPDAGTLELDELGEER
ncbi:hypothetical protein ACGFJ7_12315 [Actinoplanes sp. NPDC048988]|uniref:hypothetical protein n=1 Tax=Actinoplanes sp. NPDC048988 TaxID=3363901 RepID=UPI0037160CEB